MIPGVSYVISFGIESQESFGTVSLETLSQISAESIASLSGVGLHDIYSLNMMMPSGIISQEIFGDINFYSIAKLVATSISSSELFGNHIVAPGGEVFISHQSISSLSALGSHLLIPGEVTIFTPSIEYLSQMGIWNFIFNPLNGTLSVSVHGTVNIETKIKSKINIDPSSSLDVTITTRVFNRGQRSLS